MTNERILEFDEDNFDEQIKATSRPILVDFWAAWCAPCRQLVPALEELAEELAGRAHVAKVNVDDNGDLGNRFGVRAVPTLVVFKNGKVVDQLIGAAPKSRLRELLQPHLD